MEVIEYIRTDAEAISHDDSHEYTYVNVIYQKKVIIWECMEMNWSIMISIHREIITTKHFFNVSINICEIQEYVNNL